MHKKIATLITLLFAGALAALGFMFLVNNSRFRLSDEYYGKGVIKVIKRDELDSLIEGKKSFLLFVSQSGCRTADDFRKILKSFLHEYPIQIFEIEFSDFRTGNLPSKVRFYPSLVIYHNGEMGNYLETDNDAHSAAYTSVEGLRLWLEGQIILQE